MAQGDFRGQATRDDTALPCSLGHSGREPPAKDLATSGHLCQPFGDTAPTIPASWRSQQAQTPDVGVTGL